MLFLIALFFSDADKEEEEPMSIKDKIKAFENEKNKLIIPPPVDVTPQGRIKNSEAFTALEGKQLFIGMVSNSWNQYGYFWWVF